MLLTHVEEPILIYIPTWVRIRLRFFYLEIMNDLELLNEFLINTAKAEVGIRKKIVILKHFLSMYDVKEEDEEEKK